MVPLPCCNERVTPCGAPFAQKSVKMCGFFFGFMPQSSKKTGIKVKVQFLRCGTALSGAVAQACLEQFDEFE